MNKKFIELKSQWGVTLENIYIEQNSDTLVIILPGEGYSNAKPIMYYTQKIASEIGLDVLCIDYGFQISHKGFDINTEFDIVAKESEQVLKKCLSKNYKKIIFIGKSLGTIIQNELSKELVNYEQVHIYLTPVDKTFENITNHLCLVITGTADNKINSFNMLKIEKMKNIELVKIDGGNHRLECSDTLKSIEMLKETMKILREFITKYITI
ncbi:alpha/beta hydrolase [Clostridium sp. MB40-C1]|uniref:alpha/beta hydrolase n=1 Tax=Clostridium sp. MB40-C1 TaxID=3070996 RepID=UPI0027DFB822|nr:alpha/beta hydrolase [Clostridium sp. MB40-C1]WMJ81651.1 alpha/beta hydrolase [Clostridium sp. MB40-C1]